MVNLWIRIDEEDQGFWREETPTSVLEGLPLWRGGESRGEWGDPVGLRAAGGETIGVELAAASRGRQQLAVLSR